jgi:hypothetical protein
VGEDREGAVRGGVVLLLQPGGAVGADGGVVVEVLGQDVLGGLNVRVEDGLLRLGVRQALELGCACGQLEQRDGVGQVDGGGPALLEIVEARLDVGEGVFWCCCGWVVLEGITRIA